MQNRREMQPTLGLVSVLLCGYAKRNPWIETALSGRACISNFAFRIEIMLKSVQWCMGMDKRN